MKVKEDKNSSSPAELREPASPDSEVAPELLLNIETVYQIECFSCGGITESLQKEIDEAVRELAALGWRRNEDGESECPSCSASPATTATQADDAVIHGRMGERCAWCEEVNATLATQNSAVPPTQTGDQLSADPWAYLETRYQTQVKVGKYTIGAHWAGLGDPNEIKTIMRRISAVPDLLTFADAYRRSLTNRSESDMSAPEMELLNMADAAIAKAEGKDS